MEKIKMILKENKKYLLSQHLRRLFRRNNKNMVHLLTCLVVIAGFIMLAPDVLAVGDAPDAGLSTGVTNLLAILNNKLTPVILIAGCLASLVYSLSIAQPKPFILGLVTLCAFGFAKAWIAGTYALIG